MMKNKTKILLFVIFLILSIIITMAVIFQKTYMIDNIGYNIISKYMISDIITPIIKVITWFGSAGCLIAVTILFMLLIKNKKIKLFLPLNLIIITIMNQLMKYLIQRPRPIEHRIINETGYSFPSGHSMISMSVYGFLIYLSIKYIKNKYLKTFIVIVLSLLILLIGISRVYLGVHYISDVIGGFIISISYLILFSSIIEKYLPKK